MIKIALQNNGNLNAGNLLPLDGRGTVQSLSYEAEGASFGGDGSSFPVIFAKMVNKASQTKKATSSSAVKNTNSAELAASGAGIAGEQKTPLFMLKIKGLPAEQEKAAKLFSAIGENMVALGALSNDGTLEPGDDVFALELDLQALLQAVQNEKTDGDNPADPAGLCEAAEALSSYLAAMISMLQNQGDTLESGAGIGSAMPVSAIRPNASQGGAELTTMTADNLLALAESLLSDSADDGNKILLLLPKELVKGFVTNENGQPHFAPNGFGDGETSSTVQLVRLNTQASSSSPQGALLAAVAGLQKSNQTTQTVPAGDSGNGEAERTIPVNPFQNEAILKNSGERQVREIRLPLDAGSSKDGGTVQAGPDPRPVNLPQGLGLAEQDSTGAPKGLDIVKDASLVREDSTKGTLNVSGKESGQGVPYAGATSPQVPLGAGAPLKGVFIPMDRLISEAGAALEKGAGKVQMTLQPPSLGTINMEVIVHNNRVELVLTSNHADVQQLLQANSDQLKNALNNQGFQVDQMSVLLRRESFGFNMGGNPLWQDGAGRQQGKGNGSSASPSTPEPEALIPRDYGTGTISIFA